MTRKTKKAYPTKLWILLCLSSLLLNLDSTLYAAKQDSLSSQVGIILVPSLRIREVPGKEDSPVIGGLFLGNMVNLHDAIVVGDVEWIQVSHVQNKRKYGWVKKHYVGLVNDLKTPERALYRARNAIDEKLLRAIHIDTLLQSPVEKILTAKLSPKEFALAMMGAVNQRKMHHAILILCHALKRSPSSKWGSVWTSVANLMARNEIIHTRQATKQLSCKEPQKLIRGAKQQRLSSTVQFLIYRELWKLLY